MCGLQVQITDSSTLFCCLLEDKKRSYSFWKKNHRGHTIVVVAYRLDREKKEREKNTEREVEGKAKTESFPVILCEQPKCSSKYAPARSNFDQSDPLQLSV